MFDLRWIRENPDVFDAGLSNRGTAPLAAKLLDLDRRHRAAQTEMQLAQARRNEASKQIGKAKAAGGGAAAKTLIDELGALKARTQDLKELARTLAAELDQILLGLPNLAADDVPVGEDEAANLEIRKVGGVPKFEFHPKQHDEIGEALGYMDFSAAASMSGARFVVLRGPMARLERALYNFMLDLQTGEFGYVETAPPLLVRAHAMLGAGQLPKFAEESFRTTDGYWLIPTAEVPLANLVRERILDEADLPLRLTAGTMCFRSEAGAAGKDTRGMIRQHQFLKVELVSITTPEHSPAEHERMTRCAETILERLGLPYRVVVLSTGDMGFAARKTYDIEVWLPGQGRYREISSCSNCGDFQARRMQARYRPAGAKATEFVHTLNGSGLAVGRTLIAVLENNQRADGTVLVPEALSPYMGGLDRIGPAR